MNTWLLTSMMLLSVAPCLSQESSAQKDVVEAVRAAHRAFNIALEKADVATLDKLIADTYVFTDPNGRVTDKKGIVDGFRRGIINISSQEVRDVTVRVYDSAAVETGELTSKATREGRDTSGTFRYTRVWVNRNGTWQTVAFQETRPVGR